MRSTARQARSFAVVGAIGFVVDGGLLTLLYEVFAVQLLNARLVSFSAAVTTTWLLNRQRTFADRKKSPAVHEWSRYAVVNSAGALLNMGIFFGLINRFSALSSMPLVPLAIAASIALAFNFFASKHLAFRYPRT